MGLLNFGKKKKEKDISKALETIPIDNVPALESKSSVIHPLDDISPMDTISSGPIPIPKPLIDSTDVVAESVSVDVPESSEVNGEIPFETLPDFSEDDFSAPQPPENVVEEKQVPKKESISELSSSTNNNSLFGSTFAIEKTSNLNSGSSYAASQGVFVARKDYFNLLNTLQESSKSIKTLKIRQKHLIDFDLSMKKLFENEATEFEKLHKDILAIMPFVSKK